MTLIPYLKNPKNVRRAIITAMIVGPILTLINQTPSLMSLTTGQSVEPIVALRIALTFLVPFIVSLVSAAMADRSRQP